MRVIFRDRRHSRQAPKRVQPPPLCTSHFAVFTLPLFFVLWSFVGATGRTLADVHIIRTIVPSSPRPHSVPRNPWVVLLQRGGYHFVKVTGCGSHCRGRRKSRSLREPGPGAQVYAMDQFCIGRIRREIARTFIRYSDHVKLCSLIAASNTVSRQNLLAIRQVLGALRNQGMSKRATET